MLIYPSLSVCVCLPLYVCVCVSLSLSFSLCVSQSVCLSVCLSLSSPLSLTIASCIMLPLLQKLYSNSISFFLTTQQSNTESKTFPLRTLVCNTVKKLRGARFLLQVPLISITERSVVWISTYLYHLNPIHPQVLYTLPTTTQISKLTQAYNNTKWSRHLRPQTCSMQQEAW